MTDWHKRQRRRTQDKSEGKVCIYLGHSDVLLLQDACEVAAKQAANSADLLAVQSFYMAKPPRGLQKVRADLHNRRMKFLEMLRVFRRAHEVVIEEQQ